MFNSIPWILYPNSPYKDFIHASCFMVSDKLIYSASVDDRAMVFCFLETQLTGPPANFIRYPVTDFLPFTSEPQSASAYPINPSLVLVLLYTRPMFTVD